METYKIRKLNFLYSGGDFAKIMEEWYEGIKLAAVDEYQNGNFQPKEFFLYEDNEEYMELSIVIPLPISDYTGLLHQMTIRLCKEYNALAFCTAYECGYLPPTTEEGKELDEEFPAETRNMHLTCESADEKKLTTYQLAGEVAICIEDLTQYTGSDTSSSGAFTNILYEGDAINDLSSKPITNN